MSTVAEDSTPPKLTDLPDRLSPMLVKELRQGLRTNLFVTSFILLQALMILCILMGSEPGANQEATGFFWFFLVVAFIVVQPLRGFGALSSEYNLNTMDLIQLTTLNAWRITVGKWFAINAQSFLLLVAVIPYLVLRYFFGSVDVVRDMGFLGLLFISSALLSAMTVGCSAFKNLIIRITLLVICTVVYVIMWQLIMQGAFGLRASVLSLDISLLVYSAIFGIYFFLALGASKIAPAAENHAFSKRIIGLVMAVGAWSFQFFGVSDEYAITMSCIIMGLTLIDAITEETPVFASVMRPFLKTPLHRLASWFLTPGWHTGILYFLIPGLVFFALIMLFKVSFLPDFSEIGVVVWGMGMISFPLIIMSLFLKNSSLTKFAQYLFIQACLAVITILTLVVSESAGNEELIILFAPLPSSMFFRNIDNDLDGPIFLIIGLFWLALSLILPFVVGMKNYREMSDTARSLKNTAT